MEITDIINYQLAKIESILREDLSDGSVTLNYLICENETKFLDKYSLTKYIRKKKIRNTSFLETISIRCKNVIQLINYDLKDLPFTKENFAFKDLSNPDDPFFLSTHLNFHAIYLSENKFHFYDSELSKQTFLKDFKSNSYDIYEIAQRCNLILNIILSSCPDINVSDETKLSITANDKVSETDLQTKIKLHFDFFQKNCPRKHKQILKDEDFEKLIKWTTLFFENDFEVPEIDEPISKVNTNKTYVQGAFKALFNELRPSNTYPVSLFEFYKNTFKPYANDTRNNFDKARINDEVYKRMNIDY